MDLVSRGSLVAISREEGGISSGGKKKMSGGQTDQGSSCTAQGKEVKGPTDQKSGCGLMFGRESRREGIGGGLRGDKRPFSLGYPP